MKTTVKLAVLVALITHLALSGVDTLKQSVEQSAQTYTNQAETAYNEK